MTWTKMAFLDEGHMYDNVIAFPSMLKDALSIADRALRNMGGREIKNVICCGMGGSGIGFEIIKAWVASSMKVPLEISRDYDIPSFVNNSTLVISSSYSGDTEETISSLIKAKEAGAQVVVITSGGQLATTAVRLDVPLVKVPNGLPPRAALPYLLVSAAQLLENRGLIDIEVSENIRVAIPEIEQTLRSNSIEVSENENKAKNLSKTLFESTPLIYGHGLTYAIALRFKQQLNENSKVFSHCNQVPELHHNEVEGFGNFRSSLSTLILLRSSWESKRIAERFEITSNILSGKVDNIIQVRALGSSSISEALSMISMLDLVTVYLALLRKVNPSNVSTINTLKNELNAMDHFNKELISHLGKLST